MLNTASGGSFNGSVPAYWLTTGPLTIESAKTVLAGKTPNAPIYLRWFRTDSSESFSPSYWVTVTLESVTKKRLRVKDLSGNVYSALPARCLAAFPNPANPPLALTVASFSNSKSEVSQANA